MKDDTRWKLIAGIGLVTLSLAMYLIHYLLFQDAHHILLYLVGDIAFIPLEVLIVTLIIDQMLETRERKQRMEKLNMVIGTFFSNAGTPFLTLLSRADPGSGTLRGVPGSAGTAVTGDFDQMKAVLCSRECTIDIGQVDLAAMRDFLIRKEEFLLRLVENPMVFEHESFTDLLLALSHLAEELKSRDSLEALPPEDIAHLTGDIRRVYSLLVPEWLKYMAYLRDHYPYLFSLAMRKNPFDPSASVVIGKTG
jgi:hypothetical protein